MGQGVELRGRGWSSLRAEGWNSGRDQEGVGLKGRPQGVELKGSRGVGLKGGTLEATRGWAQA